MHKNQPEHGVIDPYQKTAQVPDLPIYQDPAPPISYFTELSPCELVRYRLYMQQHYISALNSPYKSLQPPEMKHTLIMVPIILNKQTPDTFKYMKNIIKVHKTIIHHSQQKR